MTSGVKSPTSPLQPSLPSPLADLGMIALLVAYAVSMITLLWPRPFLLALLLLPAPLLLVLRLGRGFATVAAIGSFIGPATEVACVSGGLWSYSETGGLPLIPPWLFLIWACFPTALLLIVRAFTGGIPHPRPRALPLALGGIALQIMIFIEYSNDLLPLFLLTGLLACGIYAFRPERATLLLMASGCVLGPVCEALPVSDGAWFYARADISGMPVWLPVAYALFAALVTEAGLWGLSGPGKNDLKDEKNKEDERMRI